MNHWRISLDCQGRTPSKILEDLGREMTEPPNGRRVVLLLNRLRELDGTVPKLLDDVVDFFHDRRVQASIIDPTGIAGEAYAKLGGSLLVEVCTVESEVMRPREILLVEDEEDSLKFMSKLLTEVGHRVTCASTGREALRYHEKARFEVVFLDFVLPDIDGITIAKHLSESGTPVIGISAHLDRWNPLDLHRAGFTRILPKPFQIPDLLAALRLA